MGIIFLILPTSIFKYFVNLIKKYYFVFTFFWYLCQGQCQHTPPVLNYKASAYKAHQQNWAIDQASDRIMYMANSEGLLSYNGNTWTLHNTKNQKIVRSVKIVKNRIYTGSYGEIGYWTSGECNELAYHSLTSLVPENAIAKEEIWNILPINDKIYFQSFSVLLVYDGKKIEKVKIPGSIMFLYEVQNRLIFQALDHGLYELKVDNSLEILSGSEFFIGKTVTGILPYDNQKIMITTNSDGIYLYNDKEIELWNPKLKQYFSEIQINKALRTQEGILILGSIRDGMLAFKADGSHLYKVNTSNGLQNNSILSMMEDCDQNIWLGLDKGITTIDIHNELKIYYDVKGLLGTIYTAATYDSILYLGTNQGVYYSDQRTKKTGPNILNDFKLVKGTQGQVWQLKAIKPGLLCGHNEGTFIIKGDKAKKVSNITGGWYTEFIPNQNKSFLLQGTYTGLVLLSLNHKTILSQKLSNFNEPVKKFLIDKNLNIWVVGPFTGLYKLTPDSSFTKILKIKKYGIAEGITMDNGLDLNMLSSQIVVSIDGKYYQYDEANDKFVWSKTILSDQNRFLLRSPDDVHWFKIYNDSFVMMDGKNSKTFKHNINKDYHSVVHIDSNNVLFCLDEGYAISNYSSLKEIKNHGVDILFDHIVGRDFCLRADWTNPVKIPYYNQNFKVYFHHSEYKETKTYQYKLKGNRNEDNWLTINDPAFISFSGLPSGEYTLIIQSSDGNKSRPLKFYILPPWYQSSLAMFLYFCSFIFLIYMLKEYIKKIISKEKIKLEIENERLLREHKYVLENDRLTHDNILKSKELANSTMHLIQKNELLQEIKAELIDVRKTGDHTLTAKDFQNLMKLINENMTIEDDKNLFESNFNDVHEAFLKKLKIEFPDLTAADLKLSAYLKMNLASKEIASLFNISVRGLENKRYRLRKKLNLPNDANLNDFFMAYKG